MSYFSLLYEVFLRYLFFYIPLCFVIGSHGLDCSDYRPIILVVDDQSFKRYTFSLVKQIHDPIINPVRHLIIKIPDIDPLGDVLCEGPVGNDPVKQFSFYGVHGDILEKMKMMGNQIRMIPARLERKL